MQVGCLISWTQLLTTKRFAAWPLQKTISFLALRSKPLRSTQASALGAAYETSSRDEAYAAETVIGYLNSWKNIHLFYKQFRHCCDGGIAEGVQDRMQLLWADRWSEQPKMVALTEKEPDCNAFVMRSFHTEAFPKNTFAKVLRNTKTKYPVEGRSFCRAVRKAAKVDYGL